MSAKKLKKKAQTIKRTKAVSLSNTKGTVTYAKSTVSYKKAKSVKLSKKQLKKYKKSISKKFVVSKTTGKITAKKRALTRVPFVDTITALQGCHRLG